MCVLTSRTGRSLPFWSFFGYDEPNYTYAPNGRKLLGELSALSPAPVYVRVHNLLTTGDGSASLKWGSTNIYTEDAAGKPIYSWTILDQIFDTFHDAGIKPLVEIGFMPQALSTHPEPYRHNFPHGEIFTGWAYPPKDYQKWSELVFQFVVHLRERYGEAETQNLALGSMERARHWILERNARRIFQVVRFFCGRCFACHFRARVLAVPTAPAPRTPKPRNSCASFWTTALIRKTM